MQGLCKIELEELNKGACFSSCSPVTAFHHNLTSEQIEAWDVMKIKHSVNFKSRDKLTAKTLQTILTLFLLLGAQPDQHVLSAPGPVLHVGAGGTAAKLRHDLHEPTDHRTPSRQQESCPQEDNWHS